MYRNEIHITIKIFENNYWYTVNIGLEYDCVLLDILKQYFNHVNNKRRVCMEQIILRRLADHHNDPFRGIYIREKNKKKKKDTH